MGNKFDLATVEHFSADFWKRNKAGETVPDDHIGRNLIQMLNLADLLAKEVHKAGSDGRQREVMLQEVWTWVCAGVRDGETSEVALAMERVKNA